MSLGKLPAGNPLLANPLALLGGRLSADTAKAQAEAANGFIPAFSPGGRSLSESVVTNALESIVQLNGGEVDQQALLQAMASLSAGPSARDLAQSSNMSLKELAQFEEMRLKQLAERQNQELAIIDKEIVNYDKFLKLVKLAPLDTQAKMDEFRKTYGEIVTADPSLYSPSFMQAMVNGSFTPQDRQYFELMQQRLDELKAKRADIEKNYNAKTLESAMRREEALRALENVRSQMKKTTQELMKKFQEQSNGDSYDAQRAAKMEKKRKAKRKEAENSYYEALGYGE